jgi:hypothetical protein
MTDDTYNGWTNRETWAVALHINNDRAWQEAVHQALAEAVGEVVVGDEGYEERDVPLTSWQAGDIIREIVEETLSPVEVDLTDRFDGIHLNAAQWMAVQEIGSMWRVNWDELGAAFLADLD